MFARAQRIHVIESHQPQQRGDRTADLFAQGLAVRLPRDFRRGQRRKHTDRQAGIGAGRIDRKLSRVLERQYAVRAHPPFR